MGSDIDVLNEKVSSLSEDTKGYIHKEPLWGGKYLLILNKNYPFLPPQHSSHERVKLPMEINKKIISEMRNDNAVKNFLSVDLQYFLSLFENDSTFMRYFSRDLNRMGISEEDCKRIIREIKRNCMEEYDDENHSITLKLLLSFGVIDPFSRTELDLEEPDIFFMKFLQNYFFRNIIKFLGGTRFNFREHLLSPLIKILNIFEIDDLFITDNKTYLYLNELQIQEKIIQDFLCCFQYHSFFEGYSNSFFEGEGKILDNPLIIFNPSERRDRNGNFVLEGYFELDGSLCIIKDKKLILIECKNGDRIHPQHITNFIGKSRLIEKIYGVDIRKLLFSTGSRYWLWQNFEDYNSCSDIGIFCRESFIINFSDLSI